MRTILILIIGLCALANLSAQDYHARRTAPAKALKHYKKAQQYIYAKDYTKALILPLWKVEMVNIGRMMT